MNEKRINSNDEYKKKIIDLKNKNEEEILKAYEEIARDSYIQDRIYEAFPEEKIASMALRKYRSRKEEKGK